MKEDAFFAAFFCVVVFAHDCRLVLFPSQNSARPVSQQPNGYFFYGKRITSCVHVLWSEILAVALIPFLLLL